MPGQTWITGTGGGAGAGVENCSGDAVSDEGGVVLNCSGEAVCRCVVRGVVGGEVVLGRGVVVIQGRCTHG